MSEKFHDIGQTYGEPVIPSPSSEKHYPSVYINLADVSELDGVELDDSVEILFKARVKSIHLDEYKSEVCLELRGACVESIESGSGDAIKEEKPGKADEPKNEADRALSQLGKF